LCNTSYVTLCCYHVQVPLAFVLMSSRRTRDYTAVIQAIINVLPKPPAVQEIVLDFEKATWRAVRDVLPNTVIHGCHWTQSMWQKYKKLDCVSYTWPIWTLWRTSDTFSRSRSYQRNTYRTHSRPCSAKQALLSWKNWLHTCSKSGLRAPPGHLVPGASFIVQSEQTTTLKDGIGSSTDLHRKVSWDSTCCSSCCTRKRRLSATTSREASQTTAFSEEDLPKSAGEDPPLLGRVHRRTEDVIAAAEGMFASVCGVSHWWCLSGELLRTLSDLPALVRSLAFAV